MKYKHYTVEDFTMDSYFQKWVLDSDAMTDSFWRQWLEKHPEKRETLAEAKRMIQLLASKKQVMKMSDADFEKTWQDIIEDRKDETTKNLANRNQQKVFRSVLRVAAIFVGLLVLSVGVYYGGLFNDADVVPILDGPQVTLELEDGTIKVLNEKVSGAISNSDGKVVVQQEQNQLLYDENTSTETLAYNELTVPYGKKFEVLLSDGTHVFLNSGSKLRYPVRFLTSSPRDVYLDGEGYFDVVEDVDRPFTVITDDMNTQVYGTEFNVSSYKNEGNTSTVLVEGSVGVYRANNEEGIKPLMITPGQRAVYDNDQIAVEEVPIRKYVAWKDGLLYFVDDRFELLLKELERHFNVSIDNQYKSLEGKRFTGTFTNESLDQILKVAQAYGQFEYTIDGNQITLTKTNEE